MAESPDYEVKDIVRRHGGVCILVYIPSLDKDISVNSTESSFNEETEYETKRRIEESVKRYLFKPPQMMGESKDKVSMLKDKLIGGHSLKKGT